MTQSLPRGRFPAPVGACWQWRWFGWLWMAAGSSDWPEDTTGVDCVVSFWASRNLARKTRIGGHYYLYSPDSRSGCTARFTVHTLPRGRALACASADPPFALLPVSCRGGSTHVCCWLSILSSWWNCASFRAELQPVDFIWGLGLHWFLYLFICVGF